MRRLKYLNLSEMPDKLYIFIKYSSSFQLNFVHSTYMSLLGFQSFTVRAAKSA